MTDEDREDANGAAGLRIDRWLWFARFYKSRALATKAVEGGGMRLTRAGTTLRVDRASQIVKPGDVLTLSVGGAVRVIAVAALGARRGPPAEARLLYDDLQPPEPSRPARPVGASGEREGRPNKKDRRALEALRRRTRLMNGGEAG